MFGQGEGPSNIWCKLLKSWAWYLRRIAHQLHQGPRVAHRNIWIWHRNPPICPRVHNVGKMQHKCRQISQFRMQYTNSGIGYYSSSERKKYSQTCQKSLKHGSNAKNQDHGSTATQYQSSIVASSTGDAEASRWRVTYPYSASKRFLRFNTVL